MYADLRILQPMDSKVKRMSKPNGKVIWSGASLIDGQPIVVIATGLASGSTNRKTGEMVQTYILRADLKPTDAIKAGADVSICGACPHRGDGTGKGRTCYVNVGQGPLAVWNAWQRGAYPTAMACSRITAVGEGRIVRLGTYGDPAAVPAYVWQQLTLKCVGHTGYTHQWRAAPQLKGLCMASADSVEDAREAQAQGWRTFRVAMPCDEPRIEGEAICPASAEAGKKLQCAQCLACGGADGRRGSIAIAAHGGFSVMANVKKRIAGIPVVTA
jgi:hypothetical protein